MDSKGRLVVELNELEEARQALLRLIENCAPEEQEELYRRIVELSQEQRELENRLKVERSSPL